MEKVSARSGLSALFVGLFAATLGACSGETGRELSEHSQGFTAASTYTASSNQKAIESLPQRDTTDHEAANRGFIGTFEGEKAIIRNKQGDLIWDLNEYTFIDGASPDSTHPGLWRQAGLNNLHGLFEVTDRIFQVRGFDLANMTIIQGDT